MNDVSKFGLEPPSDFDAHLGSLHKAYMSGDILALFQAFDFSLKHTIPLPKWVGAVMEDTLRGMMMLRSGFPGRGNSSFGGLRKAYVRTVRASAYHYVRAWQKEPLHYASLPRQMIDDWYSGEINWIPNLSYTDSARFAAISLHGTEFQANASTMRKSANRFLPPVGWGRADVEVRFKLRGPNSIFCSNHKSQPDHIKTLLEKRKKLASKLHHS